jgi:hypothetical protein
VVSQRPGAAHCASVTHCTQIPLEVLQDGFAPFVQSASAVQSFSSQRFVSLLQVRGWSPIDGQWSSDVHSTHPPSALQCGAPSWVSQSTSLWQVPARQLNVVGEHCPLRQSPPVTHSTQVFVPGSQCGFAAVVQSLSTAHVDEPASVDPPSKSSGTHARRSASQRVPVGHSPLHTSGAQPVPASARAASATASAMCFGDGTRQASNDTAKQAPRR